MTFEEYALKIAEWLRKNPRGVKTVAKDIANKKVSGSPITLSQASKILDFVEAELGDFGIRTEEFDSTGELTLMDRLRQEVEKAMAEREMQDGNG